MSHTRRDVLAAALGIGIASGFASRSALSSEDPFALGVASGDPWPDGIVLWTRLVRDPLAPDGGMGSAPVEVIWEVARDEHMKQVIKQGVTLALPELAYSLHVEVGDLEPARWYWYRFRAGNAGSPIGRTRTAPAPGAQVPRVRFAAASCQHWMYGNWGAYRRMLDEDLDVVLHLGDYIYEAPSSSPAAAKQKVRDVPFGVPKTLQDYRQVHAFYKTDPAVRAAHAAFPWITIWDDHDVENDYAGDRSPHRVARAEFLQQRAAAYQAYWEHMPLRLSQRPNGPDASLYRRFAFGDMMDLAMLDERQYRSPLPCPPSPPAPDRNRVVPRAECADSADATRTMIGHDQERWLARCLAEPPRARWMVIGQQLMFAPFLWKRNAGLGFDTDGWGGYAAAHQRMLDLIASRPNRDTLVVGGDVHAFVAANIPSRAEDFRSPPIATHVACGPISSRLSNHEAFMASLPENPHVEFVDARRHGYTVCTLEKDQARFDLRAVDDVRDPAANIATLASFVVQWGNPKLTRV